MKLVLFLSVFLFLNVSLAKDESLTKEKTYAKLNNLGGYLFNLKNAGYKLVKKGKSTDQVYVHELYHKNIYEGLSHAHLAVSLIEFKMDVKGRRRSIVQFQLMKDSAKFVKNNAVVSNIMRKYGDAVFHDLELTVKGHGKSIDQIIRMYAAEKTKQSFLLKDKTTRLDFKGDSSREIWGYVIGHKDFGIK